MRFRNFFAISAGFLLVARPDVTCVWNRLVTVAKSHRVQSIRDVIPIGVNHRFNFETKSALHSIEIFFGNDGSFTYRSTAWAPNPPVSDLEVAQQSLFEVDELLDGRCNLGRPSVKRAFDCSPVEYQYFPA